MKVKQLKTANISGVHIYKLGILATPGDKFKLTFRNNNLESEITIGGTGIYEIDMDIGIASITAIHTAKDYIIDILYDEVI